MPRLAMFRPKTVGWALISGGVATALLLVGLVELAPRLSPTEASTLQASSNLEAILMNPLHLPMKLLGWLAISIPGLHPTLAARLPSVFLALVAFFAFMYITHRWYGKRSMVFGCLLFVCSAWFLHVGRFAGMDIEFLAGMLALLAVNIGLHDHEDRPLALYGWLAVSLILLSVPGFAWFVLLGIVWQWRILVKAWQNAKSFWNRLLWATFAAGGITALGIALVRSPELLWPWLGLPARLDSWQVLLGHIGDVPLALVWRGPHNPELWLAQLPLLDAFLIAMLVAGFAFYIRHWRAARTRLLISYLVLGALLTGIGGPVRLSAIMPIVYLIITGGTAYSLHFWLRHFPKNQFARALGITIMSSLILLSSAYSLSQYFIAWPRNPETVAILQNRPAGD